MRGIRLQNFCFCVKFLLVHIRLSNSATQSTAPREAHKHGTCLECDLFIIFFFFCVCSALNSLPSVEMVHQSVCQRGCCRRGFFLSFLCKTQAHVYKLLPKSVDQNKYISLHANFQSWEKLFSCQSTRWAYPSYNFQLPEIRLEKLVGLLWSFPREIPGQCLWALEWRSPGCGQTNYKDHIATSLHRDEW